MMGAVQHAAPFVFEAMGTVVSVTAAGEISDAGRVHLAAAFEELEARFSLYRPKTEGAKVARRELLIRQTSEEYKAVYDAALDWRSLTGGAFTPHRPDGNIDLSGIVKALAIEEAAAILDAEGTDWCINAGGDVLVSGHQADGRDWVVGIVDPDDRSSLLSQYAAGGRRCAVATSGIAERGEHVWRTGANSIFHQVTVVADDIVTADVLATAIVAGGPDVLDRVQQRWSIEVLACAQGGRCWATPAFRA